ncbi:MAG: hypothetical protein WC866_04100 [Patescibacteria group bacterium]|jgi:hypothetical protein
MACCERYINISYDTSAIHGGKHGCYRARFRHGPSGYESGSTPAEAVGNLVISHPSLFAHTKPCSLADCFRIQPEDIQPYTEPMPLEVDAASASLLGRLVTTFPDVYGVMIALIEPERFPQQTFEPTLRVA